MKTKNILITFTYFLLSCNTNTALKDSVDSANKQNQSKDSNVYGTGNMDSMAADERFLVNAFSGGMLEVMLGKIAQQNAASARVKQFGQMMVTDHTKADSEMAVIAKLKDISLPDKPGDDEYKNINRLQAEHGIDFDKDYTSLMIDDHKEDIEEFNTASQQVKDPDIKAYVLKTIPVLKKHLTNIQLIDNAMKK